MLASMALELEREAEDRKEADKRAQEKRAGSGGRGRRSLRSRGR